jgi:hypothetical protein
MSLNKKIYIGNSKTHGQGIIVLKPIKTGELIFKIQGSKIKFLINNLQQAKVADLNWIGLDKNTWIDPINFGRFLNHSCNPNSIINNKIYVKALRNIKIGEEISIDYSLNEADIFWTFKCQCNSKKCRKVIRSIQFLPEVVFKKYHKYISAYYKGIYLKFNISNFISFKNLKLEWINFIKKNFNV